MSTLLFLLTVLSLFILFIIFVIKLFKRKPVLKTLLKMTGVLLAYGLLWLIFFLIQTDLFVPFGTEVCFDDWCATVNKFEKVKSISDQPGAGKVHYQFIILYVTMSNHARGIAQKPSEPRIHLIDDNGRSWANIAGTQKIFELKAGEQPALDARLDLHQSLQTRLVFEVPDSAIHLRAVIEEGPCITRLLLADNRQIFKLD